MYVASTTLYVDYAIYIYNIYMCVCEYLHVVLCTTLFIIFDM